MLCEGRWRPSPGQSCAPSPPPSPSQAAAVLRLAAELSQRLPRAARDFKVTPRREFWYKGLQGDTQLSIVDI